MSHQHSFVVTDPELEFIFTETRPNFKEPGHSVHIVDSEPCFQKNNYSQYIPCLYYHHFPPIADLLVNQRFLSCFFHPVFDQYFCCQEFDSIDHQELTLFLKLNYKLPLYFQEL